MPRKHYTFAKASFAHRRFNARRSYAFDYFGNKCSFCGGKPARFFNARVEGELCPVRTVWSSSEERFLAALEQTVLLCGKCYGQRISRARGGFRHGTYYAYRKRKCRCDLCMASWEVWKAKRRVHEAKQREVRRRVRSGRQERAFNPTA